MSAQITPGGSHPSPFQFLIDLILRGGVGNPVSGAFHPPNGFLRFDVHHHDAQRTLLLHFPV